MQSFSNKYLKFELFNYLNLLRTKPELIINLLEEKKKYYYDKIYKRFYKIFFLLKNFTFILAPKKNGITTNEGKNAVMESITIINHMKENFLQENKIKMFKHSKYLSFLASKFYTKEKLFKKFPVISFINEKNKKQENEDEEEEEEEDEEEVNEEEEEEEEEENNEEEENENIQILTFNLKNKGEVLKYNTGQQLFLDILIDDGNLNKNNNYKIFFSKSLKYIGINLDQIKGIIQLIFISKYKKVQELSKFIKQEFSLKDNDLQYFTLPKKQVIFKSSLELDEIYHPQYIHLNDIKTNEIRNGDFIIDSESVNLDFKIFGSSLNLKRSRKINNEFLKEIGMKLRDYFVAFSNTKGGKIIFGVHDTSKMIDGEMIDEILQEKIIKIFDNTLRNSVFPQIECKDFELTFLNLQGNYENLKIIILSVLKSHQFYVFKEKGGGFKSLQRQIESNLPLDWISIKRKFLNQNNNKIVKEKINKGEEEDDFITNHRSKEIETIINNFLKNEIKCQLLISEVGLGKSFIMKKIIENDKILLFFNKIILINNCQSKSKNEIEREFFSYLNLQKEEKEMMKKKEKILVLLKGVINENQFLFFFNNNNNISEDNNNNNNKLITKNLNLFLLISTNEVIKFKNFSSNNSDLEFSTFSINISKVHNSIKFIDSFEKQFNFKNLTHISNDKKVESSTINIKKEKKKMKEVVDNDNNNNVVVPKIEEIKNIIKIMKHLKIKDYKKIQEKLKSLKNKKIFQLIFNLQIFPKKIQIPLDILTTTKFMSKEEIILLNKNFLISHSNINIKKNFFKILLNFEIEKVRKEEITKKFLEINLIPNFKKLSNNGKEYYFKYLFYHYSKLKKDDYGVKIMKNMIINNINTWIYPKYTFFNNKIKAVMKDFYFFKFKKNDILKIIYNCLKNCQDDKLEILMLNENFIKYNSRNNNNHNNHKKYKEFYEIKSQLIFQLLKAQVKIKGIDDHLKKQINVFIESIRQLKNNNFFIPQKIVSLNNFKNDNFINDYFVRNMKINTTFFSQSSKNLIVFANLNGGINIFNLDKKKFSNTYFSESQNLKVNDLYILEKYKILYSCCSKGSISEWNLISGTKRKEIKTKFYLSQIFVTEKLIFSYSLKDELILIIINKNNQFINQFNSMDDINNIKEKIVLKNTNNENKNKNSNSTSTSNNDKKIIKIIKNVTAFSYDQNTKNIFFMKKNNRSEIFIIQQQQQQNFENSILTPSLYQIKSMKILSSKITFFFNNNTNNDSKKNENINTSNNENKINLNSKIFKIYINESSSNNSLIIVEKYNNKEYSKNKIFQEYTSDIESIYKISIFIKNRHDESSKATSRLTIIPIDNNNNKNLKKEDLNFNYFSIVGSFEFPDIKSIDFYKDNIYIYSSYKNFLYKILKFKFSKELGIKFDGYYKITNINPKFSEILNIKSYKNDIFFNTLNYFAFIKKQNIFKINNNNKKDEDEYHKKIPDSIFRDDQNNNISMLDHHFILSKDEDSFFSFVYNKNYVGIYDSKNGNLIEKIECQNGCKCLSYDKKFIFYIDQKRQEIIKKKISTKEIKKIISINLKTCSSTNSKSGGGDQIKHLNITNSSILIAQKNNSIEFIDFKKSISTNFQNIYSRILIGKDSNLYISTYNCNKKIGKIEIFNYEIKKKITEIILPHFDQFNKNVKVIFLMDISKDGKYLICTITNSNFLYVFNLKKVIKTQSGNNNNNNNIKKEKNYKILKWFYHDFQILCFSISSNNKYIVTSSIDFRIRCFNFIKKKKNKKKPICVFTSQFLITNLSWLKNGSIIAGTKDGNFLILNLYFKDNKENKEEKKYLYFQKRIQSPIFNNISLKSFNNNNFIKNDLKSVSNWLIKKNPDFLFLNYNHLFEKNHITLEVLFDLNENHLKEIGIKSVGHRLLILKYINQLKKNLNKN